MSNSWNCQYLKYFRNVHLCISIPGEFDDDIEATTFTRGKIEGLIAHERYEFETRGGVCIC